MNHFIEIGKGTEEDSMWITVHSGSRNLGIKIWSYWKKQIGKTRIFKDQMKAAEHEIKRNHRGDGRKIKEEIDKLHSSGRYTIPPSRFLTDPQDISGYLGDMFFAQAYAEWNRKTMVERIKDALGLGKELERIESIHNYIDPHDRIIRKGAIRAYSGEKCVIPMNMAYGILVCVGKSNPEWNYSAPHGAGRVMSRGEARKTLGLEEFKESMSGVFSTSIVPECIDESPAVYKDPEEIIGLVCGETVDLVETIKPLVSIKAGGGGENGEQ